MDLLAGRWDVVGDRILGLSFADADRQSIPPTIVRSSRLSCLRFLRLRRRFDLFASIDYHITSHLLFAIIGF